MLLLALSIILAGLVLWTNSNNNPDEDHTISKDVVIIGGGSSGTYAAVRLQQMGYSVALIEKKHRLGGHVNTFYDAATNTTFDYGVITFDNITVVLDYFNYFNIPLTPHIYTQPPNESYYAKFGTNGQIVQVPSSMPWTNANAVGAALVKYGTLLAEHPYLTNGFDLPDPVPEDLLMNYGAFIEKHNLGALAYVAFQYIEGVGNILAQPTLYVMKYFAKITVQAILGSGVEFLTTAIYDNQELYNRALAKLGSSAFVSSHVFRIERNGQGVQIQVATPSGYKLIKARKLLVAIPPTLENLISLDLDLDFEEENLFAQFNNSYYWDMVIRNSGIPDDVSLNNVDLSAPLGIPSLPGLYGFSSTGLPGLHAAWYSSPHYMSNDEVKADTLATLGAIVRTNGYPTDITPEFVGFHNHAPFELTVSVDAVRAGFYRKLNLLQGQRNTWWTGAAWQAQDSTQIWNWTEYTLLPKIVASLSSRTIIL